MLIYNNIIINTLKKSNNLKISIVFSFIERILKTIFIIQTLDTLLTLKNNMTYEDLIYSFKCTVLLSIRYIFASNRHVFAYKASLKVRNEVIQYYYRKYIEDNYNYNSQVSNIILLNNIGDKIKELIGRISIDLIPAIISILIGCYNLIIKLDIKIGTITILYIFIIEYIYNILSKKYNKKEHKLLITLSDITSKMFGIISNKI